MKQNYNLYETVDQGTWNLLFARQVENLQDKACKEFLQALQELQPALHERSIPKFSELDQALRKNDWKIHVVPGLIPAAEFLGLLADGEFCSSTWLRSRAQLDYLEEPDMFHDIFGHIPLLADPAYATFIRELGVVGREFAAHPEAIDILERFYWFTVEFGMVKEGDDLKIYGAGILSSFLESKHVFGPEVELREFDLEAILFTPFRKDELQGKYYVAPSMQAVYDCLPVVREQLRQRFRPAVALAE